MKKLSRWLILAALWAGAAGAQTTAPPLNVLQLSSAATLDVTQDLLIMTLAATREANDAQLVQSQLQQQLSKALEIAKQQAKPGLLEVHTGNFGLYPRYDKDGKLIGWQGRAELVLQGSDFERITRTAAQINGMPVSQMDFALSRQARAQAEAQAQSQAIASFQEKAQTLTRAFGFTAYTVREVNVSSNEMQASPRFSANKAADAASIPVEAGKAQVVVNVSGSVQMK